MKIRNFKTEEKAQEKCDVLNEMFAEGTTVVCEWYGGKCKWIGEIKYFFVYEDELNDCFKIEAKCYNGVNASGEYEEDVIFGVSGNELRAANDDEMRMFINKIKELFE